MQNIQVIKENCSEVNYILATPDRRRKIKKVHVNLIKKYHSRLSEPDCTVTLNVNPDITNVCREPPQKVLSYQPRCKSADECANLDDPTGYDLPLCNSLALEQLEEKLSHLEEFQKQDLNHLLQKYPSICRDKPGECTLIEHDVFLVD